MGLYYQKAWYALPKKVIKPCFGDIIQFLKKGDFMTYKDFVAITDLFSISALITLSIYHLLIYVGRKEFNEEKYNLYFALFSFSLAGYILIGALTYFNAFDDVLDKTNLAPPLEGLFIIGIMVGFHMFLSPLIKLPSAKNRIILYALMTVVAVLLLPFFCPIMGYEWYQKHLFFWVLSSVTIYLIITFYLYGSWIIRQKLYFEKAIKLIVSGIAILLVYLLTNKFLLLVDSHNQFAWNNLIISIVVYIFAYAEVVKFNTVHKELIVLKEKLEQKVEERTIELSKSKEEIERISQEKTNYFINLAHETKTPLTLINNYLAKYISKTGMNKEIGIIKQNIDKLSEDMVNFLDAEKLERGQVFYNHDQISSISKMLNDKILIFKEIGNERNLIIETRIDPDLFIKADPYALERVINNLVENAFKYTHENGRISIGLSGTDKAVKMMVSDTGIGMPAEQMEHIFEPYYQISHQKQNIQGIGMGLYMVKMIIDQVKGRIKVQSSKNVGTTFFLTFNRLIPDQNMSISAIQTSLSFEFVKNEKVKTPIIIDGRHNLLIVEDNHEMLNYLIDEFSADYNVYPSVNGEDALQKIRTISTPDIIISDIMMDGMDGKAFFNFISKDENFNHIPFIFLTARKIDDEKVDLLNMGAIDFITKPFSVAALKAKIKSIIETESKLRKVNLKEMIEIITNKIDLPKTPKKDGRILCKNRCKQYGLTSRQEEIILHIAEGNEYKEIATRLNISHKTVIRHVQNLYEALNVHNKVELNNLLFD
jgi:signal transduction histidine kinase/DNA-binding NarL/FixJ family response regulator